MQTELDKIKTVKNDLTPTWAHESVFNSFCQATDMVANGADSRIVAEALFDLVIEFGLITRGRAFIGGKLVEVFADDTVCIDGKPSTDYSLEIAEFIDNRFNYPN